MPRPENKHLAVPCICLAPSVAPQCPWHPARLLSRGGRSRRVWLLVGISSSVFGGRGLEPGCVIAGPVTDAEPRGIAGQGPENMHGCARSWERKGPQGDAEDEEHSGADAESTGVRGCRRCGVTAKCLEVGLASPLLCVCLPPDTPPQGPPSRCDDCCFPRGSPSPHGFTRGQLAPTATKRKWSGKRGSQCKRVAHKTQQ